MASNFDKIKEFHVAFNLPCSDAPSIENMTNFKVASLRVKLIAEEFMEFKTSKNEIERLDAIGDLLYVIYGAGASFGFNMNTEHYSYCVEYYPGLDACYTEYITNFKRNLVICDSSAKLKPMLAFIIARIDDLIRFFSYSILMCNVEDIKNNLTAMLFQVYKLAIVHSVDADALFDAIHTSNMTKLCKTEAEAMDSVRNYQINDNIRYPDPSYEKIELNGVYYWVIFDRSTGKRLKSINYKEPMIDVKALALAC